MEAEEQGLPGLSSCCEPAGYREQLSESWRRDKDVVRRWLSSCWGCSDSGSPGV